MSIGDTRPHTDPVTSGTLELSGKRAVVMGLGRFGGGLGAARFLARGGARVLVTDLRPADQLTESLAGLEGFGVETRLGGHEEADFAEAEIVVANPAVPPDHALLERAREAGARITTATELFLRASPARTVGVTGTQGKSSTCHALAGLVEHAGGVVHAGGNLGGSLLDRLDEIAPTDLVVLELSSYQLEALGDPSGCGRNVDAVAVTNVHADHLERHGSLDAYVAAKARIFELAGPDAMRLVPASDPRLTGPAAVGVAADHVFRHDAGRHPDARLAIVDGAFVLDGEVLGRVDELQLPGAFQSANVLVALGLARLSGTPASALARAIPALTGLPHRMEDLGMRRERRVVDNGVSTTPDSTEAALVSVDDPVTLVAGGQKKDLPLEPLTRALNGRDARVVTFGRDGDALAETLAAAGVTVAREASVEDALERALSITPRGGTVLFSPACASFDAYPNFRERALAFRAELDRLCPRDPS